MVPEIPNKCPLHFTDNKPCSISINHYRNRSTGPCIPLAVICCSTHNIGFTIYPPGFVPYGRLKIAPVSFDGNLIKENQDDQKFSGTYFDAAMDAANGEAWPDEDYDGNLIPLYCTQIRHLNRATKLLGIDPGMDDPLREEIAQILSVSGQLHHDCTLLIKNSSGYQDIGTAIYEILKELPVTTSIFERIAEAGASAGIWSAPFFWNIEYDILQKSSFHRIRTRASP